MDGRSLCPETGLLPDSGATCPDPCQARGSPAQTHRTRRLPRRRRSALEGADAGLCCAAAPVSQILNCRWQAARSIDLHAAVKRKDIAAAARQREERYAGLRGDFEGHGSCGGVLGVSLAADGDLQHAGTGQEREQFNIVFGDALVDCVQLTLPAACCSHRLTAIEIIEYVMGDFRLLSVDKPSGQKSAH